MRVRGTDDVDSPIIDEFVEGEGEDEGERAEGHWNATSELRRVGQSEGTDRVLQRKS